MFKRIPCFGISVGAVGVGIAAPMLQSQTTRSADGWPSPSVTAITTTTVTGMATITDIGTGTIADRSCIRRSSYGGYYPVRYYYADPYYPYYYGRPYGYYGSGIQVSFGW